MNKKILIIISSILFSLILWGSVTLSSSYFTTISVPVKLTSIPKGYGVGYKSLKETNLKIKGEGWKLISLTLGNTEEYIVPTGKEPESKFVRLSNALGDNPWLSSGLQVFDISPDTMTFRLEKLHDKSVIIKPDVELDFKPGYGLVSPITIVPESLVIYGPQSLLKNINSVQTISKTYSNLDDAVSERIDLKKLENISFNRYSCDIKFEIQKIVDRSFDNLPIEIRNVPKGESLVLIPSHDGFDWFV
jgi:YbbR domain-containing protein